MSSNELTVDQMKSLDPNHDQRMMFSKIPSSYDEFIDAIYVRLDKYLKLLQEDPDTHSESSEDHITGEIVRNLRSHDFNASKETKTGGHVDIRVEYPTKEGMYVWLCEAKRDTSVDHVYEGFLQLTTRYATGISEQSEGSVLLYVQKNPLLDFMTKTKEKLQSERADIEICECKRWPTQSFVFETPLPRIGGDFRYKIRYIGVSLYFLPQDKSGRAAKKYQKQHSETVN